MQLMQGMYANARNRVRVGEGYSEEFGVKTRSSAWTFCRVQTSSHALSVTLEWAATASSAMAASTGCTRNAVGSSA